MDFASLLSPIELRALVEGWLKEDLPSFDVGGFVVGNTEANANLYCKQRCKFVGVPFFNEVFQSLGCRIEWKISEGSDIVDVPCVVAVVTGPARKILLGERPALNCISRASGVATKVAQLVKEAEKRNWRGRVAATRKTTPGFRIVEKYAVIVGGGDTHRFDLSSMVMLKDNHISACGGDIEKAISMAKSVAGFSTKIEVESRNAEEAERAASGGADVVMLDNFKPEVACSTAKSLKARFPNVLIEISGGVNEANVADYFSNHVGVISMGALTQGYPCVDFSLKIV